MVSLESMRKIYKEYNYTDQQLQSIRAYLYNFAELQLKLNTQQVWESNT